MHRRGGIELRGHHRLSAIVALVCAVGCGAPSPTPETRVGATSAGDTAGAPAPSVSRAAETGQTQALDSVAPLLHDVVGRATLEPQLLTPLVLVPHPAEPARVRVALLNVGPSQSFRPPTGACQDMLLLVRRGELRAVGTGIAPPEAPSTLYAGDAVRFGPEGDGLVQNLGEQTARTVVAFVRAHGEPSFTDAGPSSGEGCEDVAARDPLLRPMRSASVRSVPPRSLHGGALRVRVLLDDHGASAHHGSLAVIDGDPDLTIPTHRHEGVSEILFVEDGSGTMRIGEREVVLRPGMALYVPAGVLHDFRGDGSRPLRGIELHAPAHTEHPASRAE